MDEHYLRHEWRKVTLAAGLDGLLFRDLRRTGISQDPEPTYELIDLSRS